MNSKTNSRLTILCLVKTSFAGWVCRGFGGTSTCWVPQMGHMRTPSLNSTPQVLQIILSSP
ncbi:MAG: hypothetical protein ACFN4O_08345 [Anaeroglobus sp.]